VLTSADCRPCPESEFAQRACRGGCNNRDQWSPRKAQHLAEPLAAKEALKAGWIADLDMALGSWQAQSMN